MQFINQKLRVWMKVPFHITQISEDVFSRYIWLQIVEIDRKLVDEQCGILSCSKRKRSILSIFH